MINQVIFRFFFFLFVKLNYVFNVWIMKTFILLFRKTFNFNMELCCLFTQFEYNLKQMIGCKFTFQSKTNLTCVIDPNVNSKCFFI
jgi:hypothetical protein